MSLLRLHRRLGRRNRLLRLGFQTLQAVDRVPSPPWAQVVPPVQLVGPPTPPFMPQQPPAALPASTAAPAKFLPEILIGNVPLHPHSAFKIEYDKITAAFHDSSRKTPNYIPPSVQNGEVLVLPTIDMIRAGSHRWNTTAVGYFLADCFAEVGAGYGVTKTETYRSPGLDQTSTLAGGIMDDRWSEHGGEWNWPTALPDAITRACTRLDFARVCVMLNVSSKLPKHIIIMMPNKLGGESACKVDVEYEWLPPKCTGCTSLRHSSKECPLSKPTKPAVSIYVRKTVVHTPAAPKLKTREQTSAASAHEVVHPVNVVDTISEETSDLSRDKAPPMFPMLNRAIWNVRAWTEGTTKLQSEILLVNSCYILSLYWKLELCNQMSHVSNQAYYLDGDDLLIMRDLGLIELAGTVGNVLWLVGGDFNAVLDMSEVSGASGDIRVAMNEFNDCILQTGLLSLPMQGECFTWHNCSLDGRSLWKRLDRLFVDDVWMDRWPNMIYTCLTPCTSDHSPCSLCLAAPCRWFPMYSVTRKLKALKPVFRQQRRNKGDLAMNVKLAAGSWRSPRTFSSLIGIILLLLHLEHCCRLVFLKATKLEHVMLPQRAKLQWLKGGDQCSKVFFHRVATRRANKRVFQIADDDGNEQTDPTFISSVFVDFFQGLLGGARTVRALDLQYLRPWARHILTEEEALAIIHPVTIDEVKTTFFDIEEDKAPWPNGFSSGFFKAAWPIVGEEV
ncbi:hypothetical protein Sango_3059200 [Sesamum angolense]|uniref:Reverse transcriptase n=1 Tax=Sesamum angolense TaxID=2727404 RepID=A0AAE1TBD7_9LAMI|nr:hypothetical protein Sango_3059200 [Sesamum angolense]